VSDDLYRNLAGGLFAFEQGGNFPSPVRERGRGEGAARNRLARKSRLAARPLIRPFGPPSPEREKGRAALKSTALSVKASSSVIAACARMTGLVAHRRFPMIGSTARFAAPRQSRG
jgi:hypothetical protein